MQDSLLYIIIALISLLICVIGIGIYLLTSRRKKKNEDKTIDEMNILKEELKKLKKKSE